MPASARRSSIGSRRLPTKYVPYRGDDLQHGKKTGMAVAYVDHKSDEFEPFEKVIGQADQRTPPRVHVARKRRTPKPRTPIVEEEDDENGEMSMELEDSTANSPSAYFAHARVRTITSSLQRIGSSQRPVAHGTDVDFDKVPSPRASPARNGRKSLPRSSLGPSHLSHFTLAQDFDNDMQMDDGGAGMDDGGGGLDYGGFDDDDSDNEPAISPPPRPLSNRKVNESVPRRTSFAQIDQDDEDDEEEPAVGDSPNMRANGKQRASRNLPHQVEDQDMEDEIAQGFAELEHEPMDVDEEEEEEEEQPRKRSTKDKDDSLQKEQPVSKKSRIENEGAKKPKWRSRVQKQNVLRDVTPDDNNADGLRRGKRKRYKPLEWWRLEKVVYGPRLSGGKSFVPNIREIHRIPKEDPEPLGAKNRKRRKPRSKSKSQLAEEPGASADYNPEEGWDDETVPEGTVIDYADGVEITKKIAFTAKMLAPKPAANHDFYFQKVFGEGDFIAAGQLIIPPNKQKPTKGTRDNTFVFYLIEGAVTIKVHRASFVLATGGMFLVPRGNMYFIQNISDRNAKLFFAQARKVAPDEEEGDDTSSRAQSLTLKPDSHLTRYPEREDAGPSAHRSPSARASLGVQQAHTARSVGAAASKRAASTRAGS